MRRGFYYTLGIIMRRGFYYASGILLRAGDFIMRRGFYYTSGILRHRPTRNTFITRNIITPSPEAPTRKSVLV